MRPAEEKQAQTVMEATADNEGFQSLDPDDGPAQEGFLTREEAGQLREERLAAIRRAVADGLYDTDEMLERALEKMLQRIDTDSGSSESVRDK
jgi:hypothetical protein